MLQLLAAEGGASDHGIAAQISGAPAAEIRLAGLQGIDPLQDLLRQRPLKKAWPPSLASSLRVRAMEGLRKG